MQVGAGIMDSVCYVFLSLEMVANLCAGGGGHHGHSVCYVFLSLEMVANLCAGGGGHHGHSVCYVFCLWKWWQTSVQVGAGIMDIVFVMFFVFGNGGWQTSVQVGAGILDIVFVIVVLSLKMVVNLW